MTIPTRPAPPPPQARNFNGSAAAADANASLEQLRLQLQQQQQQQKITIKLPPPPKGNLTNNSTTFPMKANFNNNASSNHFDFDSQIVGSTSSITRKFPKARYAPTTNWDDAPFEATTTNTTAAAKKVPPPRPPPPKVLVNGQQTKSITTTSTNILTNIFHRKKSSSTTATTTTTKSTANNNKLAKQNSAARVYGLSSGNYASTTQTTSSSLSSTTTTAAATYDAGLNNVDWNAAWNSTTTTTSNGNSYYATTTTTTSQDAQLISFDSPPSSPTFTQKSNSDCLSVDSFSSDSNFSSPQNGSVSQPESGFEDDFSANGSQQSRSRPATTSPMDPWETFDAFGNNGAGYAFADNLYCSTATIGTAPVRNLNTLTTLRTNGQAHPNSQDNPLCNGKSLLPPAPAVHMPTIIKPKISQKPKAPKPPAFNHIKQFQKHQSESSSSSSSTDLPTPPSPPMPQCAPPPPPPSILDVISGKVDALQLAGHASTAYNTNSVADDDSPPYGIALYDFDGAEEGDLCFREGEKIYLLEQASNEWYRGRTRAGCEGLLPANYIDVKVPLKLQNGTSTTATATATTTHNALPKVRCLYDFPAEMEGDLALKENDMVTILYRINEDWLFGEMNNRQGQFPANFLEYIPPNIPLP